MAGTRGLSSGQTRVKVAGGIAGAIALAPPLAAAAVVIDQDAAHGYPVGHGVGACSSPVNYRLNGTWQFPPASSYWPAVATGFHEWNSVRNSSGGQLVNVLESSSNPIEVSVDYSLPAGVRARASCSNRSIRFNPNHNWNASAVRAVASHEMGHVLGLGHTGKHDNISDGAQQSRLATCRNMDELTASHFTTEDRAALSSRRTGNRVADGSFESGGQWKAFDGTTTRLQGGASAGNYYQVLTPGAITSYLTQLQSQYYNPGTSHAVQMRVRAPIGAAGSVSGQIWTRTYYYESDLNSSEECSWPSDSGFLNIDANVRLGQQSQFTLRGISNINLSTSSWSPPLSVAVHNIPLGVTNGSNAVDVQVRVTSGLKYMSGALAPLHVDDIIYSS